jgi:hypothetical protein
MKQTVRGFELIFLLQDGAQRTRRFKTEGALVKFLKATYATEAPLSFIYADGSAVSALAIDRIYKQVYKRLRGLKISPQNKNPAHREASFVNGRARTLRFAAPHFSNVSRLSGQIKTAHRASQRGYFNKRPAPHGTGHRMNLRDLHNTGDQDALRVIDQDNTALPWHYCVDCGSETNS